VSFPLRFREVQPYQGLAPAVLEGWSNLEDTMTRRSPKLPRTSTWTLAGRIAALVAMAAALGTATGCANVAPYERGKLAHPTMVAADMAGAGESHLRAISEGAVGGSGGTGSGCGCN
jgi:hypothetical protein